MIYQANAYCVSSLLLTSAQLFIHRLEEICEQYILKFLQEAIKEPYFMQTVLGQTQLIGLIAITAGLVQQRAIDPCHALEALETCYANLRDKAHEILEPVHELRNL